MTTASRRRVSRRSLLKTAGLATLGAAAGSGAITGFPTIWAQNIKNVTLRQFGTGVSNLNAIAEKVKQDLGFTLADDRARHRRGGAEGGDAAAILRHRRYRVFRDQEGLPHRRDAADGCEEDQAVRQDRADLHHRQADAGQQYRAGHRAEHGWRSSMGKTGTKFANASDRMDDADPDHLQCRHAGHPARPGRPADQPTGRTWSIRPSRARRRSSTFPSIGIMDAAMVMESLGTIKYVDKGNMTKPEIDKTIAFLIETKKSGQFRAFWKTLRRKRQPDGLGRGGDPVDVVARGRCRARQRASRANTSRSRKAIAPGPAGSAWRSI